MAKFCTMTATLQFPKKPAHSLFLDTIDLNLGDQKTALNSCVFACCTANGVLIPAMLQYTTRGRCTAESSSNYLVKVVALFLRAAI